VDAAAGERVLAGAGFAVRRDGPHLVVAGAEDPAEVTRALAGSGIYLSELTADTVDLEEAFLLLTADEQPGELA
jgi:ABC-2 type transport system ATP-binding protein